MKNINESRQGLKSPKLYDILKNHGGFMDSKPSFYLHDMIDDDVIGIIDDKSWDILYHGNWNKRVEWAKSHGYIVNKGDNIDIWQLKDGSWVALIERGGNLGDDEYLKSKIGKLKNERYKNRLNRGDWSYQWSDTGKWGSPRAEEFYMRRTQNDIANQRKARYGDDAVYKLNESVNSKEVRIFTDKLIKKLYTTAQPYTSHRFRDNDWRHLKTFIQILSNVEGVEELIPSGTGPYKQSQEGAYKEYRIDITTSMGSKIGGFIRCHFCGSMENPWDVYDMTVGFWREDNPIGINENDIKNMVGECIKRILSENNYKTPYHKVRAAINASSKRQGKSPEEVKQEISDINAQMQAIKDINKDRSIRNMSNHEQRFNNPITYKTFDTDFTELDYYDPYYDDFSRNNKEVEGGYPEWHYGYNDYVD